MVAGYIPQWMSMLQAIEQVRLISGGSLEEAWGALEVPLREGVILSRFRGQEVGGVETTYLGGSGAVPRQWWYAASVFNDGSVEFAADRLFGRRPPRREIEIRRSDLLQIWPAPETATQEPPLGKPPPGHKTVSYAELKTAIEQHGDAAESKLIAHGKTVFPGMRVPRQLLRRAREDLFGKPRRGAPKRAPDKSPQ